MLCYVMLGTKSINFLVEWDFETNVPIKTLGVFDCKLTGKLCCLTLSRESSGMKWGYNCFPTQFLYQIRAQKDRRLKFIFAHFSGYFPSFHFMSFHEFSSCNLCDNNEKTSHAFLIDTAF